MTNVSVLTIYILVMFALFISFFIVWIDTNRKLPIVQCLFLLVSFVAAWQACNIIYYTTNNLKAARFVYDIKIPFIQLAAVTGFYFVVYFFKLEKHMNKASTAALTAIPFITAIVAFTSPMHQMMRKKLIVEAGTFVARENVRGWWFWVHSFYCYILLAAILVIVIYQYIKQPREDKTASRYIILAAVISLGTGILSVLKFFTGQIDMLLVGIVPTITMLHMAVNKSDHNGFLQIAKGKIYDHLLTPIFIVNSRDKIIDYNPAAASWLQNQGLEAKATVEKLIEDLTGKGAVIGESVTGGSMEITVSRGDNSITYKVREDLISKNNWGTIGRFIMLEDITQTKHLIDSLKHLAGDDPLTGLKNRYSFERAKWDYDTPENLPLGIIFCDLDSLKIVNDSRGHQAGDNYLIETAKCLKQACSERGVAFRIGGDEFILLIPNCTEKGMETVLDRINSSIKKIEEFPSSISIGFSVKENEDQNIDFVLEKADMMMYRNKHRLKNVDVQRESR